MYKLKKTYRNMNILRHQEGKIQKRIWIVFILMSFLWIQIIFAQENSLLSINISSASELIIVLQHTIHLDYGCMYPLTYQFVIPSGSSKLKIEKKYFSLDTWKDIPEKAAGDFFNGIEIVRFDYSNNRAYISAVFSSGTDSLFLKISDGNGNQIYPLYAGISKYYDNRRAAVTITADDWSDWVVTDLNHSFGTLLDIFRSYNLYVTVGIITNANNSSPETWAALQHELDSGFVEVASHSRSHPDTPYVDPVGEVIGSSQDIKNNLFLPPLFSMNRINYVYTWIAPYGSYNSIIDSLVGQAGYLAARLYSNLATTSPRTYIYGDSTFADWDSLWNHFKPFWPSVELGAPSWGGGDTSVTSLNSLFDTIVAKGDVYHCMWHPQVIFPDRNKSYLRSHLTYVSNRTNIWYTNLGHLYLYHLLQMASSSNVTSVAYTRNVPSLLQLYQNYPNPFNPSTTISYTLSKPENVTLEIFDALGRLVKTVLRDLHQSIGQHQVIVDMGDCSSGVYFSELKAGNRHQMKPMLLLK